MKLQQCYEVKTSILRLERRSEALAEAISQARYDLRSHDEKLLDYQGSIRSLLDKISGRKEETLETLRREVRNSEAALKSLQREKEAVDQELAEQRQLLPSLPSSEALRAEDEPAWAEWEVKYCAEALGPLLEANHKALMDYRSLMRGERPEILSVRTQQEISAEPNVRAKACIPWLQRLKEAMDVLGTPLDLGSYYSSPAAYLANVAAKHNRLDRISKALDQVEAMQKRIRNL